MFYLAYNKVDDCQLVDSCIVNYLLALIVPRISCHPAAVPRPVAAAWQVKNVGSGNCELPTDSCEYPTAKLVLKSTKDFRHEFSCCVCRKIT